MEGPERLGKRSPARLAGMSLSDFGVYLVALSTGSVAVGDTIEVLE